MDIDRRIADLEREVLKKTARLAQEAIDTARKGGSADVLLGQLDILDWLQNLVALVKIPRPAAHIEGSDLEHLLTRLESAIAEKGIVILREQTQDDLDRGWLQALSWVFFLLMESTERELGEKA